MRKTLRLAEKGWGTTSPNPMVGAIVVKDDCLVGSGWHRKAGDKHAEVVALEDAGEQARGATLYVNLEPCCTRGRTPACTDAIIASGIKRVVAASLDPNPEHNGRGADLLRANGIEVVVGIESDKAESLNEAFFCWIQHGRPYVILKMAMTIDGKIATKNGESQWISCPASRNRAQKLRRWADAVMVGAETVRRDDPELTVRHPWNWARQPVRIVASRSGDLGDSPRVLGDGKAATQVVSFRSREECLEIFNGLGNRDITAVLVEGGGELAGEMLSFGVVDKIVLFVAPRILGGRESRAVIGGPNPEELIGKEVADIKIGRSGDDIVITGYLSDVHRLRN